MNLGEHLKNHLLIIHLSLFVFGSLVIGCKQSAQMSTKAIEAQSEGGEVQQVGALALSFKVVEDIKLELVSSGMQPEQASEVVSGALAGIATANSQGSSLSLNLANADASTFEGMLPLLLEGAMTSLAQDGTGAGSADLKITAANAITRGTMKSLSDKLGYVSDATRNDLPGTLAKSAVKSLKAAGLGGSDLNRGVAGVMSETVSHLDEAGFDKGQYQAIIQGTTKGGVEGLKSLSLEAVDVKGALVELVSGAVGSLGDAGLAPSDLNKVTGPIMKEAVGGLKDLGVSSTVQMQSAVGQLMAGASKSLKKSGASSRATAGPAMVGFVEGVLSGVYGSSQEPGNVALFVDDMMAEAVGAFEELGIKDSEDIKSLTADLSSETIKQFESVGIKDSATLKKAGKALASGAMKALGKLRDKGLIDLQVVQSASQLVSKKALDRMLEQADRNGFRSDIGAVASDFALGMVYGLAAAGWRGSDIGSVSHDISQGVSDAMTSSGSFDATQISSMTAGVTSSTTSWIDDMKAHCLADHGAWQPEGYCIYTKISDGFEAVFAPSALEEQACIDKGGDIGFDPSGHWFCNFENDAETIVQLNGGDALVEILPPIEFVGASAVVGQVLRGAMVIRNRSDQVIEELRLDGVLPPFQKNLGASTCAAVLGPNSSCHAAIDFAPTEAKSYTATWVVSFKDARGAKSLSKTFTMDVGTGVFSPGAGDITVSAANFPDTLVNTTSQATLVMTNHTQNQISGITMSGLISSFSQASASTCTGTLAAFASCNLVIDFAPITPGPQGGTLVFTYGGNTSTAGYLAFAHTIQAVTPWYAGLGNWNDYVQMATSANGALGQSPSPCSSAQTEASYKCIHGGELHAINTMLPTCTGLTASDALGAFNWKCRIKGGTAHLVSVGLKDGKGLKDLVSSSAWLTNHVEVLLQNHLVAASSPAAWHTNPVLPLPDNSAGSMETLSTQGAVYVLASSRGSSGYKITGDRISLVTLGTSVLKLNASPNNCTNSSALMSGTGDDVCLIGLNTSSFNWIEGQYSNAGIGGIVLAVYQASVLKVRNFAAIGGGYGIKANFTNYARFQNVKVSSQSAYGIYHFNSNGNIYHNVMVNNNLSAGLSLASHNNTVVTRLAAMGSQHGLNIMASTNANSLAFITAANHSVNGVYATGGVSNTMHNALMINNGINGLQNTGSGSGTYSLKAGHLVAAHNGTNGINSNATPTALFTGKISFGNNGSTPCVGGLGKGIDASGPNCLTEGPSDFTLGATNLDLSSSLVGKVLSDDPVNASDTSGSQAFGSIAEGDHFAFAHFLRGWGLDGAAFPSGNNQGQCNSGTCRIWDLSLLNSDTLILNRSAGGASLNEPFVGGLDCPAEVDGNVVFTNLEAAPKTYLVHAFEIVGDFEGNENGLCESNESCVYAPNYGAYQGHGSVYQGGTCVFADGAVSGVTMHAFLYNGR